MTIALSAWRTSLSAALGLVTVACGGQSNHTENTDQGGGSGGSRPETGGTGGTTSGGSGGASGSSGSSGTPSSGGTSGASGSGSGGTSGASGSAGSSGSGGLDFDCGNPQPLSTFDGSATGFVTCEGGFIHRPERVHCASKLPRPIADPLPEVDNAQCDSDADCVEQPYGHCDEYQDPSVGQTIRSCAYGCVRDEDCYAGSICLCSDPVGRCVSASCTTDDDCGGLLCTSSLTPSPCGTTYYGSFACQTANDTCRGYADCFSGTGISPSACMSTNGSRRCTSSGACGRPFLIAGDARVANLVHGEKDWASGQTPELEALDGATRAELAAHFGRLGLMEHASVAAFARFTLELLALGAPCELVASAQCALGDEIRHAKLCFGLASAYAGHALGPGPLSAEGALDGASFEEIVNRAILEACIGETLAAVEAAEAAEHAQDLAVRRVLSAIAEDEKRHAELGWRFVKWALERATAEQRPRLEARLRHAVTHARARFNEAGAPNAGKDALSLAHGMLSPTLATAAQRAALDELVVPLARELVHAAARSKSYSRSAEKTTVPSASSICIVS